MYVASTNQGYNFVKFQDLAKTSCRQFWVRFLKPIPNRHRDFLKTETEGKSVYEKPKHL